MPGLSWTRPALGDLRGIDRWLEENGPPTSAVRMIEAIRGRAQFLESFPHGGRPLGDSGVRVLRVMQTPYLLIYRINGGRIEILRVRHEREDWIIAP